MLELLAFIQAAPSGPSGSSGSFGFNPLSALDWLTPVFQGLASDTAATVTGMQSWDVFVHTDPKNTYQLADLVAMRDTMTTAAAAGLACIVALIGLTVIVRSHRGQSNEDIRELVPRLVLGVALLIAMPALCALAIDGNNALCGLLRVGSIGELLPVNVGGDPGNALLLVLFFLAYVFMAFLLLFAMISRLGLVDVLLVLAPLAAVLWIHPKSQLYAQLWTKTFVAAVFGQFLMLLCLHLAGVLSKALSTETMPAALGVIVGIAILFLARRMLGFLSSEGLSGGLDPLALGGMALAAAGALRGTGAVGAVAGAAAPAAASTAGTIGSGWGSLAGVAGRSFGTGGGTAVAGRA